MERWKIENKQKSGINSAGKTLNIKSGMDVKFSKKKKKKRFFQDWKYSDSHTLKVPMGIFVIREIS